MVGFSATERTLFRGLAAQTLVHTYTRLRRLSTGGVDDWNGTLVGDDPAGATASVACRYQPAKVGRRDETGKGIDERAALLVATTDTLAAGDLVSNVRDADGTLLLAGPAIVSVVEPFEGGGALLLYRAPLESFSALASAEIG
jgi:hypothetical protein